MFLRNLFFVATISALSTVCVAEDVVEKPKDMEEFKQGLYQRVCEDIVRCSDLNHDSCQAIAEIAFFSCPEPNLERMDKISEEFDLWVVCFGGNFTQNMPNFSEKVEACLRTPSYNVE